jgi:hypothetical protein
MPAPIRSFLCINNAYTSALLDATAQVMQKTLWQQWEKYKHFARVKLTTRKLKFKQIFLKIKKLTFRFLLHWVFGRKH